MMVKKTINLLQPDLLPKRDYLTLQNVVIAWSVALTVMIASAFYVAWQVQTLTEEQTTLSNQKRQYTNTMDVLQAQIENHKVDSQLVAKREQLKAIFTNKNALIAQLTDNQKTEVAGFAQAMTELANLHSRDISLQRAILNNQQITFQGVAKSPESVPQWLSGFEKSALLSGKHFNHFQLVENEQNYTEFSVSSDVNLDVKTLGSTQ